MRYLRQPVQKLACNAIMQYTARGGTVIAASGDGGVTGVQPESCTNFNAVFPASCPWVLSVGGTDPTSGVEVGWPGSGGGFSKIFSREDYQKSAVEGYLNQLDDQNKGLYNPDGRAIPDISALGVNIIVQNRGKPVITGDTSSAAPFVAAIISGINQKRASTGQSSLGFVNPALYAAPSAFTDITQGSNPGCNTNGFPAKPGWDPVTGLGSPKFQQLVSSL